MVATAASPDEGRNSSSPISKRQLPAARAQLVELLQRINFGRIEHLPVVHGQPVLGSVGKAVSTVKLKGENGPRPEAESTEFLLKQEIVELCSQLDRIGTGHIDLIEVKHGLPFLLEIDRRSEFSEVSA
jgi:hypothetical protein